MLLKAEKLDLSNDQLDNIMQIHVEHKKLKNLMKKAPYKASLKLMMIIQ
jgi:hypothetical protein